MDEEHTKKYPALAKVLVKATPEIARSEDGITVKIINPNQEKKTQHSDFRVKILKGGHWASISLDGEIHFNNGIDKKSLKKTLDFIERNKEKLREFIQQTLEGTLPQDAWLDFEGSTKVETSYKYATEVEPLQDFLLLITYAGGEKRVLDFKPMFKKYPGWQYVQDLKDPKIFNSVVVEAGDLHWDNDFDLDANSFYDATTEYKVAASVK